MPRLCCCVIFVTLFLLQTVSVSAQESKLNPITNPTLEELRKNFKNPHRDYSTGPLWTWNDRLTEEQVRGTLRDLAAQHIKQVWVHPRPGLMTPYLSDEWFDRWKEALDEAKKLDMNVWIYDENSYPSCFAGGLVPDAMPESRAKRLAFREVDNIDKVPDDVLFVYDETGKRIDKNAVKANTKYMLINLNYAGASGWYAGKWHTDLLKKGVTEKFLDITLDAYANNPAIQQEFGKRVPGIFTDEPHPFGSHHWTEEMPEAFEKKFGYSLTDNLPLLFKPIGDWKKFRHNWHQMMLDLFIENWAKPYFERTEKYGLEFTGHYWEHGWPGTSNGPDNMAMYAWHQRPAIDLLMNTYDGDSPNAQFGNVRSVKELASVANQMGHSRTLSENYGAGGWDLRFEDMKRLGDWSYALGVNTNNEHLSYVTIRGARKRDHPQSFSYHVPWFEGYHALADYFTRLSYVLSQGRQVNHVLVIEPTTTAWMYQGNPKLNEIGQSFTNFVNALENAQVEYDLASEDIIKRHGKINVSGVGLPRLEIGNGQYDLVILPPNTENLNSETATLLEDYSQRGGKLLVVGEFPSRINGAKNDTFSSNIDVVAPITQEEAVAAAKKRTEETGLLIETDSKNVFHHRRQLPDCEILFICNSNQDKAVKLDINTKKCVCFLSLENGVISESRKSACGFHFPALSPSASITLILTDDGDYGGGSIPQKTALSGSETKIRRLEDNVLTLDYVDVKVGDEEKKDIYTYQADKWIWQKNGFGKNPFDNEVQFKDELIKKTFPADSGFSATYRFTLDGFSTAPKPLYFVLERPDLYKVFCNGKLLATPEHTSGQTPEFKDWYLDKSFGKFDISETLKNGDNEVTITASPLTVWTALEPAYLLGDFALEPANKGFVIVPTKPLELAVDKDKAESVPYHGEAIERISWLSQGVNFRSGRPEIVDRKPMLYFEFDKAYDIYAVRIWNYNETNLKQRGVKRVTILRTGEANTAGLTEICDLQIGDGSAQTINFVKPRKEEEIIFSILSNHNGVNYPIEEDANPPDNGFVGLSEVQFLTKDANGKLVPVKNVSVKATSELVVDSHDRKAQYLIDGSGLDADPPKWGWNEQGMPFYAGKVEYSQTFKIEKVEPAKRYSVKLTKWYGATAQVVVNSQPVNFIVSAPNQVDVTEFLKDGENEIAVIVYGTPKNLLGPHHAGKLRGSAWPGSFQKAPEHQPAGNAYDFIEYGLFKDFELTIQ